MARLPQLPLHDVRALSIREIVHLWRQERQFHPRTLERELRRFVLNNDLNWEAGERIDPNTPDADLPDLDETLVGSEWLRTFCTKKGWDLPAFWFPRDPADVPAPGRPSIKRATVQEFEERRARGETEDTIGAEARAIAAALRARGVEGVPQERTIQGHIRPAFNAHKEAGD